MDTELLTGLAITIATSFCFMFAYLALEARFASLDIIVNFFPADIRSIYGQPLVHFELHRSAPLHSLLLLSVLVSLGKFESCGRVKLQDDDPVRSHDSVCDAGQALRVPLEGHSGFVHSHVLRCRVLARFSSLKQPHFHNVKESIAHRS